MDILNRLHEGRQPADSANVSRTSGREHTVAQSSRRLTCSQCQQLVRRPSLRQSNGGVGDNQEILNAFYQQGNSEQVCEMLRILITLGKRVAAVAAEDGHLLWLTYRSLCFTPGPACGRAQLDWQRLVQASQQGLECKCSLELDGDDIDCGC